MDLSSSTLTGAFRLGTQILANRRRPVLEIYQELRNDFSPPQQVSASSGRNRTFETRFQDIFVSLILINIGGGRAENVTFHIGGKFQRRAPREHPPGILTTLLRQVPPGQSFYLMRIDAADLNVYSPGPGYAGAQIATGITEEILTITVHYDGPGHLLNRLLRWPRRLRGLKQYSCRFTFDPASCIGDLPAPNYK